MSPHQSLKKLAKDAGENHGPIVFYKCDWSSLFDSYTAANLQSIRSLRWIMEAKKKLHAGPRSTVVTGFEITG